jgi:hypothetical protein
LLAVVGVASALAGLVLTVGPKLGVTGPALIAAGVVVAAGAAISAISGQVKGITDRQQQQQRLLEQISRVPIQPIAEIDPFAIGVFWSILADQTQLHKPAADANGRVAPPYVPRDVDEPLRASLEEASLARSGRLVVLRGDPKSGKSRSLWQAVRGLPGRNLLAIEKPDSSADKGDALFAPLATLAELDRPVSRSQGRDLVIWIDDAHEHLYHGLTRDVLRRLAAIYPASVIALTIHSDKLDELQAFDKDLYDMLARPFDRLRLRPELTSSELTCAGRLSQPRRKR